MPEQTPFIITHQDYSYIPALLKCLMKKMPPTLAGGGKPFEEETSPKDCRYDHY